MCLVITEKIEERRAVMWRKLNSIWHYSIALSLSICYLRVKFIQDYIEYILYINCKMQMFEISESKGNIINQ